MQFSAGCSGPVSTVGSCTFSVVRPATCNDLPLPVRQKPSQGSFKCSLKMCVLSSSNCRPAMFSDLHVQPLSGIVEYEVQRPDSLVFRQLYCVCGDTLHLEQSELRPWLNQPRHPFTHSFPPSFLLKGTEPNKHHKLCR